MQQFTQLRDQFEVCTQRPRLVGNGAPLAHTPGNALEVTQSLQAHGKAAAQRGALVEFFHALQANLQLTQVKQRLRDHAAQSSRSHWGDGPVQYTEQAAME